MVGNTGKKAAAPPLSLYRACLLRLAALLEHLGAHEAPLNKGPLDDLAGSVLEDLLLVLLARAPRASRAPRVAGPRRGGAWRGHWMLCLTPRLQCSPVAWDATVLRHMAARCTSLRRLWVVGCDHFQTDVLPALPPWVLTVDFDGQLYFRGRPAPCLRSLQEQEQEVPREQREPWLVQAEKLLRALSTEHQKVPDVRLQPGSRLLQLVELHLGEAQASAADIKDTLRILPQLRLLRHYQLVTALYQLHGAAWREGKALPTYKLRNLDADFSHVVRCRMSPEPVLAADALHLAVVLCPSTTQLRVRFDPQTPHDVLGPVCQLAKLQLLSAVCVSSGQRAHLDFSDVAGVLERHGEHLRTLELKVLEEVDVHQIVSLCPRLEELVLSGCGNVVPACCSSWGCGSASFPPGTLYTRGCNSRAKATQLGLGPLKRLRLLFYADGDDFSWDHDVPQCFWRWTLIPASGRSSHLEGIFLESPRFDSDSVRMITSLASKGSRMYPDLEVLSICRAPEFTLDLVAALCGGGGAPKLRLIHLNQCEQFDARTESALRECHESPVRIVVD